MPRGTCENCAQHDVFVHANPVAFGRNRFVCVRCLIGPQQWDEDEVDEEVEWDEDEDESNESEPSVTPSALLRLNFRL